MSKKKDSRLAKAGDKEINPYIDHKKGKRKYKDNSPEWVRQTND